MNRSNSGLVAAAFSTASRIRVTMDSESSLVTCIVSVPSRLTHPETRLIPGCISLGSDSPVIGEVSTWELPLRTMPSRGIRSPGRIISVSPTWMEDASTVVSVPSFRRMTVSGRISTAFVISRRLFSDALSSSTSPIRKKNSTPDASGYSPTPRAPAVAMVMSTFSSNHSPCRILRIRFLNTGQPRRR